LFAASDEFHQMFVPTRTARVSDVFIDLAGGALGLLALWLVQPRKKISGQNQK
jgi:VanZ family protein